MSVKGQVLTVIVSWLGAEESIDNYTCLTEMDANSNDLTVG